MMDEKARAIAALWESQKELVARIDAATSELVVSLSHDIRAGCVRVMTMDDWRRIIKIAIGDEGCQEPHGHWCCGSDVEPTH